MTHPRVDLVLRQLDSLPALPAVAAQLLRVTSADGREAPSAKSIAELVAGDPGIAARVLRFARRADGGGRDVQTLEKAVVHLGTTGVRDVVLAAGVAKAFGEAGAGDHGAFSGGGFWRHSLAVACACEALAGKVRATKLDRGEAFCCGLLHDLGKLALHAALPKAYGRVVRAAQELRCDITRVEREVIGLDHQSAGSRLCKRWDLPEAVDRVVLSHNGRPEYGDGDEMALVHLVTLGDQIARQLHLGFSGNHTFGVPRDVLLETLGLTAADVSGVLRTLVPAVHGRASDLGLDDADEGAIYRDSVGHAEGLLRRAEQDVAEFRKAAAEERRKRAEGDAAIEQERRQLAERAAAFSTLTTLSDELAAEATPRDVLTGIAKTAASALALDGEAAAVLAAGYFRDDQKMAEYALLEADATVRGDLAEGLPTAEARPVWASDVLGETGGFLRIGGEHEGLGFVAWSGDATPGVDLQALASGWAMALRLVAARERRRVAEERYVDEARRLREAREQMAHDRALIAVAELAAGAAHEMNNPLMVISGRCQQIYNAVVDQRLRQSALTAFHNAERLGGMIRQLLEYAKPPQGEVRPITVREVVDDAVKLVAATMGEEASVAVTQMNVRVPRNLPLVAADRGRWARAVAATLENAIEALPAGGGSIEVTASPGLGKDAIVLTVTDNGRGMNDATLARAFDPFYSNRPAGRGRGMGLAAARRLAETGDGSLTLDSREGEGTRAIFTMPVAQAVAARQAA